MSDKLPDEVEKAMEQVERECIAHDEFAVLPIEWSTTDEVPPAHRYIALRRSIAKAIRDAEERMRERAAKVCDAKADVMQQNFAATMNDEWLEFKSCYETAATAVRSLPLEAGK